MTGGELSCEAVVEEVAFMMLGCEGEEAFPESLQRGSRVAGWLAHQVLLSVFTRHRFILYQQGGAARWLEAVTSSPKRSGEAEEAE